MLTVQCGQYGHKQVSDFDSIITPFTQVVEWNVY